ncbi:MAG: histidine kinase [Phenylobacterium sp.]|uniref:sensor histidine kinase n=1 Tax=Phenylobacterium sp. TaxID=1871053 RepID=UPI001A381474|nr:histidine kinase [Phenylobacterium sp.]MBL8556725.1 histidine kinase [Phenylobacterium sp.]
MAGRGATMRLPRLNNYLVANFVLWTLTYVIVTARVAADPMPHAGAMAWRRLGMAIFGFLACLLVGRILSALAEQPIWRRLVVAVLLSVIGGFTYSYLNYVVFYLVAPLWRVEPLSPISLAFTASMFFWTFIAWCALYFAIRYEEELKEKNLRLVAAQALAMDAQNRMLRYQINPHFLFNTLNALSSLILAKENERAERVVLSLSSFLRHTLEKELPDKAPLSDEIEAQRQYLLIEQARFEDRLNYVETIPAELRDALAPSLILQPLVENAVKYGVARSNAPVTIEIKAEAAGGRLKLTVADDGADGAGLPSTAKLGLGLENVRRRLELIYGKTAELTCGPIQPHGFLASVEIPLERA